MRLTGHSGRRRRNSPGQALVEFTLVIPLFLTIFIAIAEFTFSFTSFVDLGFASHDGVQLAATLGNAPGTDAAALDRINRDVTLPANPKQIISVSIYWVDTSTPNGSPVGGAENIYIYDGGAHVYGLPSGATITLPFNQSTNGYPEVQRCNVNQGIGCLPTSGRPHNTVDTVGVKITYQHRWITPFPGWIGGGPTGPVLTSINVMRLEPVL
jgi:hypothetical protein